MHLGKLNYEYKNALVLEKEEMKNPRVSRRKEILNIRAEINAKEMKETIEKSTKLKAGFVKK